METQIKTGKLTVERKNFYFDLKENARGAFLRITEDVNGRRDTIIVPASGLQDFANIISQLASQAAESNTAAA